MIYRLSIFLIFTFFSFATASADSIFRAIGGIGVTQTSLEYAEMDKSNRHYGGQFVTYVSDKHAYGLEVVQHQVFDTKEGPQEYLSVCILLEAKLFKIWLNQMGIAGYIGSGINKRRPFGFRSSTGVEYLIKERFLLSILLRKDIIFEDETIFSRSIEFGIGTRF